MMKDGQTIGQWLKWDFEKNGDLEIKDKNDKTIYREYASAFWEKFERNYEGKLIFFEDSDGKIVDKRPPEIITHTNGHKYKLIK